MLVVLDYECMRCTRYISTVAVAPTDRVWLYMHVHRTLFNNVKWRSAKCNWYMVEHKSKTDSNNMWDDEQEKSERNINGEFHNWWQKWLWHTATTSSESPISSSYRQRAIFIYEFQNDNMRAVQGTPNKCQVKKTLCFALLLVLTLFAHKICIHISKIICITWIFKYFRCVYVTFFNVVYSMIGCRYQCFFSGFHNYLSISFLLRRVCARMHSWLYIGVAVECMFTMDKMKDRLDC